MDKSMHINEQVNILIISPTLKQFNWGINWMSWRETYTILHSSCM